MQRESASVSLAKGVLYYNTHLAVSGKGEIRASGNVYYKSAGIQMKRFNVYVLSYGAGRMHGSVNGVTDCS